MQYGILHSVSLVFLRSGSSATALQLRIFSNLQHLLSFVTIWICFNYYHILVSLLLSLLASTLKLGRAKFLRAPFLLYHPYGWARPCSLMPVRLSTCVGHISWNHRVTECLEFEGAHMYQLCALQQAHGYGPGSGSGWFVSQQCGLSTRWCHSPGHDLGAGTQLIIILAHGQVCGVGGPREMGHSK